MGAVIRRLRRWGMAAAACVCAVAAVLLLWPWIAGWELAQHSRGQVEARFSLPGTRVTAKLVRPSDIALDVAVLAPGGVPDGPVWVMVTKDLPTQPPGRWAFVGFTPDRDALDGIYSPDLGDYVPYPFDGLRDRSFPIRWPLKVSGAGADALGLGCLAAAAAAVTWAVRRPRD